MSKQVSPVMAGVLVVLALLVVGGIGWWYMGRAGATEEGRGPTQAPRLPPGIAPPPMGGPTAKPATR